MKIYLSSYLNNNLGDDLMIDFVCQRYPQHDFFIGNANCLDKIACNSKNLHVIPSIIPVEHQKVKRAVNKLFSYIGIPKLQIIQAFHKHPFDVNLELGGSIFMQVTPKSWINKVRDANYIVEHCKYNLIIGSNFGPFTEEDFFKQHLKLFKNYTRITFRDRYSYQLFSMIHQVQCYPDIVFNLSLKNNPSSTIGISVIDLNHKGIREHKEIYMNGLLNLIQFLKPLYHIILFSFCDNEGDLNACKILMEKGKFNEHEIEVFSHTDVKQSLYKLSGIAAMICTRFHANVLAISMKIPFIPVIYSDKTNSMLDDLEYQGYRWNIKDGETIDMKAAINQLYHQSYLNHDKLEDAKGHLENLDTILA